MPYYKFGTQDLFHNVIKTHPKCDFEIYASKVYLNNEMKLVGAAADPLKDTPSGHINLHELNVDRAAGQLAYPFLVKNGSLHSFKTVSTNAFNRSFLYGEELAGVYPMTASISREYFAYNESDWASGTGQGSSPDHISALRTTFDNYIPLSKHYAYSTASLGTITWNKRWQKKSLISIPSIFYGSSIKKGTVDLRFYISGTLAAQCVDKYKNGELIQVSGAYSSANSGSVAGVVLYNEGFILLTGSWALDDHTEDYDDGGVTTPKWVHFASGLAPSTGTHASSSFGLSFEGTNYIPTVTMMAHAKKGELNYSSNPTYVEDGQISTGSQRGTGYHEPTDIKFKNTIKSPYNDPTGSFEKQTFISKIGIFDKDKNLIAIAKLANPVKKKQDRDFTFKLKLDI